MCNVDAVIMASGLSRRMSTNKLLLPLGNSTVFGQFMGAFPYQLFNSVIVVTADTQVSEIAKAHPVTLCNNTAPEAGKSRTIALGLSLSTAEDGIMFVVADQPLLSPAVITRLLVTFTNNRHSIVVPEVHGQRCNPVIFPADLSHELSTLEGDSGGQIIIQRYQARLLPVVFDSVNEFRDIDTASDYHHMVEQWNLQK